MNIRNLYCCSYIWSTSCLVEFFFVSNICPSIPWKRSETMWRNNSCLSKNTLTLTLLALPGLKPYRLLHWPRSKPVTYQSLTPREWHPDERYRPTLSRSCPVVADQPPGHTGPCKCPSPLVSCPPQPQTFITLVIRGWVGRFRVSQLLSSRGVKHGPKDHTEDVVLKHKEPTLAALGITPGLAFDTWG